MHDGIVKKNLVNCAPKNLILKHPFTNTYEIARSTENIKYGHAL